jgi:hypothetical protein
MKLTREFSGKSREYPLVIVIFLELGSFWHINEVLILIKLSHFASTILSYFNILLLD